MKTKRHSLAQRPQTKPAPIRTTLMELLQMLSRLTTNDDMVLVVVKDIFHTHRVRLVHSLAPVRLVNTRSPLDRNAKSGFRLPRALPA